MYTVLPELATKLKDGLAVYSGMCHSSIRPYYIHLRHLHVTSFTRPSSALVLQATNAGVRRHGNEANFWLDVVYKGGGGGGGGGC